MRLLLVLVVVVSTFLAAEAIRIGGQRARFYPEGEEALKVPPQWQAIDNEYLLVNRNQGRRLFFALKQQNRDVLEALFWKVSNPRHEEYGHYLSIEDLTEIITPTEETKKAVENWLLSEGIPRESLKWTRNEDLIEVELPLTLIERIFQVEFSIHRHIPTGKIYPATFDAYSIPTHLARHLEFVSGIVGVPRLEQNLRFSPAAPGEKDITPDAIRARYNVTEDLINRNPKSTNAVAEFQHQNYDPKDLTKFFEKYVTVGQEFSNITKVVGNNKETDPQLEASLDTQFIMGVTPNASTWFVIVAPNPFWSDLLDWASILANTTDIPLIHSISYGSQGDYPSEVYRIRLDTEFQKLGLRGLSLIIASGDSGAGCLYSGGGGPGLDLPPCYFAASYPAVSAFITSVGATEFITDNSGPEAAVSQFKSGGGFDISFARPSYQDAAVTQYLNSAPDLPAFGYNASNRATPDVGALGSEYFTVINHGRLTLVGGTSASTPTFSAIVTLLNQIRLDRGDQPLGFLNPWLYDTWAQHPDAFFDVVVGNNKVPCCHGEASGFTTAPGWDPVTGVGTPNYAVLSTLV